LFYICEKKDIKEKKNATENSKLLMTVAPGGLFDYTRRPIFVSASVHAPITGKLSIPGMLFADDLDTGPFAVYRLQKGIDKVVKYCSD
jgi:hypothetical protein